MRLTARSDSADIPITTSLAPLWGPGEGWTISDEPMLEEPYRIGFLPGMDGTSWTCRPW